MLMIRSTSSAYLYKGRIYAYMSIRDKLNYFGFISGQSMVCLQLLNVCYVHLIYLPPDVLLQGMDLYFQRHDGQAVTCEDFYAAMCDANNAQLPHFLQW